MKAYPDFSFNLLGYWKEGALPIAGDGVVVVSYDQSHHAYSIPQDDYDDFLFWAVGAWQDADITVRVTKTGEWLLP